MLFAKNISEDICFSGFCIRFRPNREIVDPSYLFYMLKSAYCKKQYTPSQQTNITNLSQEALGGVMVPMLESTEEQSQAVKILVDIDSKLDINNHICNELEAMAKTLYEYWFVQFDFPDKKGNPYRTSGGEMEWNKTLGRKIPKGWEAVCLSHVMRCETDSINTKSFPEALMEHYSIPAYDDGCYPSFELGNEIDSGKYVVPKDAILVSKLNPHFKRVWDPLRISDMAICSTEFMVFVTEDREIRPFCHSVLNSENYYQYLVKNAISSTGSRKRVQPETAAKYYFPFPDYEIVERFTKLYAPILKKQKSIYKENYELSKVRDDLLPVITNRQAIITVRKN